MLALPLAGVSSALLGVCFERLLVRRLYAATQLDQVLFSIGLVSMSIASAHYFFGAQQQPMTLPAFLQGQISWSGIDMGIYRLFLIVLGLLIAFGLQGLLSHTRLGAALRAAVDHPRTARGLGIDVDRIFTLSFALGAGLAGLGGALGIDILGLDPGFPVKYMVYFLIVVAVGGRGNIMGSLVASLILGVVDNLGKYYVPQMGAFFIYSVMIVMLIFRPHGLFGRKAAH